MAKLNKKKTKSCRKKKLKTKTPNAQFKKINFPCRKTEKWKIKMKFIYGSCIYLIIVEHYRVSNINWNRLATLFLDINFLTNIVLNRYGVVCVVQRGRNII